LSSRFPGKKRQIKAFRDFSVFRHDSLQKPTPKVHKKQTRSSFCEKNRVLFGFAAADSGLASVHAFDALHAGGADSPPVIDHQALGAVAENASVLPLPQDDPLSLHGDIQLIVLFYMESLAHTLRNDDPSQTVNSADDTACFHNRFLRFGIGMCDSFLTLYYKDRRLSSVFCHFLPFFFERERNW
jgi:hypothetical protein